MGLGCTRTHPCGDLLEFFMLRQLPRPSETISIGGKTKWRLDAMCSANMRSRTATISILMDFYLRHHKDLADFVEERKQDPHPIQLKRKTKTPSGKPLTDLPDGGKEHE
jgi:hypothetical protein